MSAFGFLPSAARHGYTKADAVHAMLNAVHGPLPIPSRTSRTPALAWVGPPPRPDALVPLIEVFVQPAAGDADIYHVIAAQQQTIDLFGPTPRPRPRPRPRP